jgi:hypothetical protein
MIVGYPGEVIYEEEGPRFGLLGGLANGVGNLVGDVFGDVIPWIKTVDGQTVPAATQ